MASIWRGLTPPDVPGATELGNLVSDVDDTNSTATQESYAEMFDTPRFDPATDTVGVWVDGQLVGFGSVSVRDEPVDGRVMAGLQGLIHPEHRGRGLGRALLDRLEARGVELASERFPGMPEVRLRTSGGKEGSSAQRLLEAGGYLPDNYFVSMEVELDQWADPGVESTAGQPDRGAQPTAVVPDVALLAATRDAHNDAFRDHRNHSPIAADHWAQSPSGASSAGWWPTRDESLRTRWPVSTSQASLTSS